MPKLKTLLAFFILSMLGVVLNTASANTSAGGEVLLLSIDDAIGPATDDYIDRALENVSPENTRLVVIRIDTPGGLDTAMRGIIKNITRSQVPVVGWVAPTGSRAASAGTYILYASHIAAMAPGTNLGAATPVAIGGLPGGGDKKPLPSPTGAAGKAKEPEKMDASKSKSINDAAAYIRGLAELRGRNQEWAEKAVLEAASLSASEALELNVIDLIAADLSELLKKIDGMQVRVGDKTITLDTGALVVRELQPDWRSRLLSVITNPNIAYILLLVGIYGLILEFSNPGAVVPGTVGAIALLLALYALQLLPINYAGFGLILLGLALMIGEAYQPSFGILGIGGLVAFVIGSVILMDTDVPGYGINLSLILSVAIASAIGFILLIGMMIRLRKKPVVSGSEELVGASGVATADFDATGNVFVHSELWHARTSAPLTRDQRVRVTGMDGLVLEVEPLAEESPPMHEGENS
jgi:membrane-bound serine protease (ClpP class)